MYFGKHRKESEKDKEPPRTTIFRRLRRWHAGDYLGLWEEVSSNLAKHPIPLQINQHSKDDSSWRNRVIAAVKEGNYSKAARLLDSLGVHLETEQVLESLKKLHPQSTVPLSIPNDAPASIVKFSPEEVLRVIKSFRRDTAPGPSGL